MPGENGEQFIEHGRIIKANARLDSEGSFHRFPERAKDAVDSAGITEQSAARAFFVHHRRGATEIEINPGDCVLL